VFQANYASTTDFGLFLHSGKKSRFWKYAFKLTVCPDCFLHDVILLFNDDVDMGTLDLVDSALVSNAVPSQSALLVCLAACFLEFPEPHSF